MKFISPTSRDRLNELVGLLLLASGLALGLSLESYSPLDPSLNTASAALKPQNLLGYPGSYISDLAFQFFGLCAFLLPLFLLLLSWKWIRSEALEIAKSVGAA